MKPQELTYEENPEKRKLEKHKFATHIGNYLRAVRESRGMSQEKLSTKAGYYYTYVNKIEKGRYSPSLHTIWRLADALGMTLEQFFKGF
jgi:transcriptional regulator with XRE-family HTH domain